jgi:hypothetical protein
LDAHVHRALSDTFGEDIKESADPITPPPIVEH